MQAFSSDCLLVNREREIVVRDTSSEVDPVYIDREKQIAAFIRSGERLRASRSSYEYPDGVVPEDVQPDPTSVTGFDLADLTSLQKHLEKKQAEAAREAKQQQARAASTDAEVNVSDQKEN